MALFYHAWIDLKARCEEQNWELKERIVYYCCFSLDKNQEKQILYCIVLYINKKDIEIQTVFGSQGGPTAYIQVYKWQLIVKCYKLHEEHGGPNKHCGFGAFHS